jgi:hypothetical protein
MIAASPERAVERMGGRNRAGPCVGGETEPGGGSLRAQFRRAPRRSSGVPEHAQRMQRYLVPFGDDDRVYGEQEGVLHVFVNDDAPWLVLHYAAAYGAAGCSTVFI